MTLAKLAKVAPHVKVYRVGGYVRDKLLGLSPSDCDYVVVGATPQLMLDLGFIQVGRDFPVFLLDNHKYPIHKTMQFFQMSLN